MADTTFVAGTPIVKEWLNDVNDTVYGLSDTSSASNNSNLVGHSDALNYVAGPKVANYLKSYTTPLAYAGVTGDGVADDTSYVLAALNAGKKEIIIPGGYTFLVDGNLPVASGVKIRGEGTIKKKAGNVKPIFLLADEAIDVLFEGITIDGTSASFGSGNAVPGIFGYIVHGLEVAYVHFYDIVDSGIKLRDGGGLICHGSRFYLCRNNGIELRNYAVDVRTGIEYTGTRPSVEGLHRITGCRFERIGRIEDAGSGIVDGCGVTFDGNTNLPLRSVIVSANNFVDCLRGVWTENNPTGSEARDVSITGNTFLGNVYGTAGASYGKYGIGLIGVQGATVVGNTLRNLSNYDAPGSDRSAIILSASVGVTTTRDVVISNNTIIDDTGHADRTEYGIRVVAGTNVRIHENTVSGHSVAQISVAASNTTDVAVHSNPGAEGTYSWGSVLRATFKASNLAATNTLALTPDGYADDTEITFPMPVRLVGISVKLSAGIGGGTITINPYTNATLRPGLVVANADFSGGTIATKAIAINHADAVTIAAGQRVHVDVVTSGFSPTTADIHVTLIFDTDMKE